MTLSELHIATQAQQLHAETALDTGDFAAERGCRATAEAQGRRSAELIRRAEALRALGVRLAVLQRNRLEFARIEPMIAELGFRQERLRDLTIDACRTDSGLQPMVRTRDEARDIVRLTDRITTDLNSFVATGALIVGANQQLAMKANLAMIAAAGAVGLMLAWLVARGLTRPIIRLQAGARAVSAGQLDDADVPVTSGDEIGDVTRAFNVMVEDLREKERIKETFGQYVDPRVVAGLVGGGAHATGGEKQVATLFFSDIVGFTSIAERLAPTTLVALVNAYFSEMSRAIRDRSGIIDKYIGDAIMAFWVPPFVEPGDQARLACAAALEQFARLEAFRIRVPDLIGLRREVPVIDIRVGVASGEVVVGSVGSDQARSFTVMGDTVNFAARLEGVNKLYGSGLLIDGTTREMAGDAIETREIDLVTVVGRAEPIRVYQLGAMAGGLTVDRRRLFELYGKGLALYRRSEWAAAAEAFEAALHHAPDDGPSRTLLERTRQFAVTPPADWDGVWRMTGK
jgi:class 3 adenylate cyclase